MSQLMDNLNFKGRRVLVTGGCHGIGRAIVDAFVQLGATVITFDKDKSSLTQLGTKLDAESIKINGFCVDLADWEETKKVTESVLPIHHLVNNAGFLKQIDVLDIQEADVNSLFEVNFKAALNIGQVVAKGMIKDQIKDGTIVNISSITDTTSLKQFGAYAASKAALTSMTKTMANELGQYGIRVNYVRPGLINTELVSKLPEPQLKLLTDVFGPRCSLPCLIDPHEVAKAVVYLSCPFSAMVTGVPVTIDSGFGIS